MTTRPDSASSFSAAVMAATTDGIVVEWLFLADLDIDDDLGEDLEVGDEFRQRFAAAVDDVEKEERGEQSIAGGAAAGEDDVAGLLATESGAGGLASVRARTCRRQGRAAFECRCA